MTISNLSNPFTRINQSLFPIAIKPKPQMRKLSPTHGASLSLWLASLTNPQPDNLSTKLKVVVTANQNQLNQIETELQFCGVDAYVFPDWETLTYDELSPHQDIVSERISLLTGMPTSGILLISVQTLMQRVAPASWLIGQHFDLSVGDVFDVENQRTQLVKAGYRSVDNVFEPGEFAIRGSVIDLFAMGQPFPVRIDLFDNEIDSIRFFNPQTQRTLKASDLSDMVKEGKELLTDLHRLPDLTKALTSFQILPAKEFPLDEGRETFRINFAAMFPDTSSRKFELYSDVMRSIAPAGVEYYQPLFFDNDTWKNESSLFDYLPNECLFILDEGITETASTHLDQVIRRYNDLRHDIDKPILAPELLYLSSNQLNEYINKHPRIYVSNKTIQAGSFAGHVFLDEVLPPPDLPVSHKNAEPLQSLISFLHDNPTRTILVAETAGRREILLDLLRGKVDVVSFDSLTDFFASDIGYSTVDGSDRFDINSKNNSNAKVSSKAKTNQTGNQLSLGLDKAPLPKIGLMVAPIERGIFIPNHLIVISETQLFGRQVLQTRRRRQSDVSEEFLIKSITEMTIESPVVHIDYGIGRYHGLIALDTGGQGHEDDIQEFIHLRYADDASIYVPVTNLHLISRYSGGDPSLAPLHKIGSGKWDKAKLKAIAQIHDVAAELLNVQARRNAKEGIHFKVEQATYDLFSSQFIFEETPDQTNAIDAVIHDMKQSKPMDRLICGDVGFGKTEVAMRAAFIAVNAGYQVAVLVPTTLLAGQHVDSFLDRFADWPIKIEALSRFGGKKYQDSVLAGVADGTVDIVIGTHKILQNDVKFKNLGLMVVDEEHRFGVRHKDRIKAMQSDIDCLSMTATPIPRTLNMALSGMRDMSIIATPPARRLAIKTFVMEKRDALMKEAIMRELLRGGQVYILHNDVASIERMAETIRELVPESRVGVGHGQLNERQLEQVMRDFYHKKHNVLVCSTIIETGIDVPNANTIIIERSDKFGLAQLHQLRGRVGRSHHQAYCYLLVPSLKGLKGDAKKRLKAVEKANTLGAGFILASEDLEIRGAGELLGKQQSGNMQAMGFSLYMDMLDRATKAIKQGKEPNLTSPLSLTADIKLHCSALIPEAYLHDVHQRLLFYKRISNSDEKYALTDIRTEMIDRYGTLPDQTKNLFAIHYLRLRAEPLGITKIDANHNSITLEFSPDTPVEGIDIIKLIQSEEGYRMNGATGIRYNLPDNKIDKLATPELRLEKVRDLLQYFSKNIS